MKVNTVLRIVKEALVVGVLIGLIFNLTTIQTSINVKRFIDYQFTHEVKKIIKQDKYDSLKILKKLQQVNVFIKGTSAEEKSSWMGSGVTLKYKDKFYILSAAHLLVTKDAKLEMYENDDFISELEVVKIDVNNDLLLLQTTRKDIKPRLYTELAYCELTTAQEVIAVGNPAGLEDIVSNGRIMIYHDKYMIIPDITYFGSSGGGIYNADGDLVGIVSAGGNVGREYPGKPYYVGFEIRLDKIKQFLVDATGPQGIFKTIIQKIEGKKDAGLLNDF